MDYSSADETGWEKKPVSSDTDMKIDICQLPLSTGFRRCSI